MTILFGKVGGGKFHSFNKFSSFHNYHHVYDCGLGATREESRSSVQASGAPLKDRCKKCTAIREKQK